jgi:hypothetical protein
LARRGALALRAAGFFAVAAGFLCVEEARAFLAIAVPTAAVTAAPTTAATTPAVRDLENRRSAFVAVPEAVEREEDDVFDFMGQ